MYTNLSTSSVIRDLVSHYEPSPGLVPFMALTCITSLTGESGGTGPPCTPLTQELKQIIGNARKVKAE
ncbi:hypothetical protein E2C01_022473 [Portunus trituberculatus]|uniref:Uncharacterized protein n=1 Tax=Portunus trituberculatus TaxID=210409 RepID=A0A5B7E754_PORTR|nr:hypothetical protein [Portunus trituberculatus]